MEWPKVSIVITTYAEKTKPVLDLCIESIYNLDYPKESLEVILVGRPGYLPQYAGVKTISPPQESFLNAVGVNFGMNSADKASKYLFMANDDVIMTKNSLKNMVRAAGHQAVILSPISNCDNHGHYNLEMGWFDHEMHSFTNRQYKYEDLAPHKEKLMNADSYYPRGFIYPPTLYLYANLFPRVVWEQVTNGTNPWAIGFDEGYVTGFDDTDYCRRAKAMGVRLAICLDALVWHFSGTTADSSLSAEHRDYNPKRYLAKFGDMSY